MVCINRDLRMGETFFLVNPVADRAKKTIASFTEAKAAIQPLPGFQPAKCTTTTLAI
jgi:hypothetical protein